MSAAFVTTCGSLVPSYPVVGFHMVSTTTATLINMIKVSWFRIMDSGQSAATR
jgi:hypothetical protein